MASSKSRTVRFEDDHETENSLTSKRSNILKLADKINGGQIIGSFSKKAEKDVTGKSLQHKEHFRVFAEDYVAVRRKILDPRGPVINQWNKIFFIACLISLFVDPLTFYLPGARKDMCIEICVPLEIATTVIRSLVDVSYMINIFVRFRTAYVAPSSRVFGRGELIIDPTRIAHRYLCRDFWLDLLAAQPIPQVLIWAVIPNLKGSEMFDMKNIVRLIIIFQYLLRLYLIFPLSEQIIKATGVVMKTGWAGAAFNLMLYMLASHVLGSSWYLLAIERQEECWRRVCRIEHELCNFDFINCPSANTPGRAAWFKSSNISSLCDPSPHFFQFGIYADALTYGVTSSKFFNKYFYCLWWGLRNLSSLGQNLMTSTYVGEIQFAIVIAILGLLLFALLIGNMETYLQSTTVRLEEWRIRRTDTENWMHHRQLPQELRQNIRRYDQYRWVTTRGVDEETILRSLPVDLRRDIKRHLCLDLVRRVPLFDQMEDRILDAICERLKPALCTQGTCIVREGDPVTEMLFIIRGHLDSYTTNGGRTGFFNSSRIGPGEFCGEELLTWALVPRPSVILPLSTRTVKAITEVEAFALIAEDLKFVASQFRRLHSKQLRHTFRFHSHQWRTWAACFIQAAWFRYRRKKEAAELKEAKEEEEEEEEGSVPSLGELRMEQKSPSLSPLRSGLLSVCAAKLVRSTRRDGSKRAVSGMLSSLQKPVEPDFTVDDS